AGPIQGRRIELSPGLAAGQTKELTPERRRTRMGISPVVHGERIPGLEVPCPPTPRWRGTPMEANHDGPCTRTDHHPISPAKGVERAGEKERSGASGGDRS